MPDHIPARTSCGDLAETLGRQIDQRTCRRVRLLRVDAGHDRLVVRGVAPSYHVKQLALAAVQEVVDSVQVEVDIRVG